MKHFLMVAVTAVLISTTTSAFAQDVPAVAPGSAKYSPYPAQDFPNQVLFGDTHLHTSFSTDAGMLGNTLGPDEAYRFAKGRQSSPARVRRPDWPAHSIFWL